jgi:hypothetical protein
VFAIMTNVIVCAMLILGGASVMQALTGALRFWPAARPAAGSCLPQFAPTCPAAVWAARALSLAQPHSQYVLSAPDVPAIYRHPPSAGMNLYAASMLIPVGVIMYTAHGGLKATFMST